MRAHLVFLGILTLGALPQAYDLLGRDADLPYFIGLAVCTIYIGAHRGLNARQRQQINLKEVSAQGGRQVWCGRSSAPFKPSPSGPCCFPCVVYMKLHLHRFVGSMPCHTDKTTSLHYDRINPLPACCRECWRRCLPRQRSLGATCLSSACMLRCGARCAVVHITLWCTLSCGVRAMHPAVPSGGADHTGPCMTWSQSWQALLCMLPCPGYGQPAPSQLSLCCTPRMNAGTSPTSRCSPCLTATSGCLAALPWLARLPRRCARWCVPQRGGGGEAIGQCCTCALVLSGTLRHSVCWVAGQGSPGSTPPAPGARAWCAFSQPACCCCLLAQAALARNLSPNSAWPWPCTLPPCRASGLTSRSGRSACRAGSRWSPRMAQR